MKSADIATGLTYAVGRYGLGSPWLAAVEVIEILGGGRVRGRYVKSGQVSVVRTRDIQGTWTEHVAEHRGAIDRDQARRDGIDRSVIARREAQAYLLDNLPEAAVPGWAKGQIEPHRDYSGISGGRSYAEITVVDLAAIVSAAREQCLSEVEANA